jgi:predicted hotdog family 3-hydroxylacyl-ACP dehydratase
MPLVGPLIVLPVKTENTLKGAVADPETSSVSEHESLNDGGNMTFECAIRQVGLETTAIE